MEKKNLSDLEGLNYLVTGAATPLLQNQQFSTAATASIAALQLKFHHPQFQ
jgi:hypothetical protein